MKQVCFCEMIMNHKNQFPPYRHTELNWLTHGHKARKQWSGNENLSPRRPCVTFVNNATI